MKKVIKWIGKGLVALLLLWVILSWVDITHDNCYSNPQHSQYNFFIVCFKGDK